MLCDLRIFEAQLDFLIPIQDALAVVNDWNASKDVPGC